MGVLMPSKSDNREMVNACFGRLLAEFGRDVGNQAIKIVVEELGGLQVHIPSLRTLEIEKRDEDICLAYSNGSSYEELAFTYKLKPRQVRRIVHGG
jgi:Mor family transcriptional regulator